MAFGLIIIGDEILSGRRIDKHFPKVLELLSQRGLQLSWAEYVGDEPERITATLKRTLASGDVVFCTGGIGATPDDHTRQCAAAALGVPLALHPEAREKIRERISDTSREAGITPDFDSPENLHRLKMGEFPQGAAIIPNPYNKIPGFSVRNTSGEGAHYFAPGFPVMAWPMFEWVLETHYADLFHRRAWAERSMLVFEAAESTLTPLMELIEAEFPLVKVFSLPHVGDEKTRRHIDLGVKGDPDQVEPAFDKMQAGLRQLKAEFQLNT
ncbi:MAG: CinA-like protein [Herbaspirillum frisingense]|uniref:CinA-like protein n=1 Tax=Herbaspirillum frisingense TaxID=92645 RepID=A0A7V8FTT1_9BURK|nr:MAG: CinA-like protein [Herbaspirillum frisingense]